MVSSSGTAHIVVSSQPAIPAAETSVDNNVLTNAVNAPPVRPTICSAETTNGPSMLGILNPVNAASLKNHYVHDVPSVGPPVSLPCLPVVTLPTGGRPNVCSSALWMFEEPAAPRCGSSIGSGVTSFVLQLIEHGTGFCSSLSHSG